jgi:hypothetical protein
MIAGASSPQSNLAFYALALHLPVEDVSAATDFLTRWLGFDVKEKGDGWSRVENGALVVRVVSGVSREGLELELAVDDLPAAASALAATPGVVELGSPVQVREDRIEQRFRAPHGLVLVASKSLSEDDLGIRPALPASLSWHSEADWFLREMLSEVPRTFRADARRRATEAAEALALEAGRVEVGLNESARGLLRITPPFRQEEMRDLLVNHGIDSEILAVELVS